MVWPFLALGDVIIAWFLILFLALLLSSEESGIDSIIVLSATASYIADYLAKGALRNFKVRALWLTFEFATLRDGPLPAFLSAVIWSLRPHEGAAGVEMSGFGVCSSSDDLRSRQILGDFAFLPEIAALPVRTSAVIRMEG